MQSGKLLHRGADGQHRAEMAEVVAVVAVAVGDGEGDAAPAGPRRGPDRMRILAGPSRPAMQRPRPTASEPPAEGRFADGRRTCREHQKTSRLFDAAGIGSGCGSATLGSFGPEPPIRLFPTVEPTVAATLAQVM